MMGLGLLSVVVAALMLSGRRKSSASSVLIDDDMGVVTFAFGMGGPIANFAGCCA